VLKIKRLVHENGRRWMDKGVGGTYLTEAGLIVLLRVNRLTLPKLFSFAVADSGLSNV